MSLSSIFLNSSSMRSQIKAELEAVARSLFHSPRTNSLKASPVCAQIKSLMNIFAKHQKSGWCWSSAQPRPWRFGWKDSAATSNGPGASGAGETLIILPLLRGRCVVVPRLSWQECAREGSQPGLGPPGKRGEPAGMLSPRADTRQAPARRKEGSRSLHTWQEIPRRGCDAEL